MLTKPKARRRKRNAERNESPSAAEVQELESRQLLSATVSNGTLTIQGKEGRGVPRTIVTEQNGSVTVTQGREQASFARSRVQRIVWHGTDQQDVFENRSSVPTTAYGYGARDFLYAGSGANTLYGNGGDDVISFVRGGGVAYGGNGDDQISAFEEDVRIIAYGQRGNDQIWGGNRNDRLNGGSGHDQITGGDGNDRIVGGNGDDVLRDGRGRDVVLGGRGLDKFYMSYGNQTDRTQDVMSLGGRAQLQSESYFGARDFWFGINGYLSEKNFLG